MFFKKTKKINNINILLRNFLSYIMDKRDSLTKELSNEYTQQQRNEFVYNCAINTIHEFIYRGKTYILPSISFVSIVKLFNENMLLRQFYKPTDNLNISDKLTEKIIKKFDCIKSSLNNKEKNKIIDDINILLTSTN